MKISRLLRPGKKKLIILAVIIIAIILGFNFFAPKKQAPMQFVSVKKQDIRSTISSSGTLTAKFVANLKFKSSGKLAYINVKAGDTVSAGQVIAGLDTQQLSIELQQAQNTLRDKQAIVDKTLDDVKDHSKDETFTQRQTRTTAEVGRDNAVDSVKAAQRAFQDAVIISPIAGTVTQAPITTGGQNISGSDLIAQVVDFSVIYFDTDVDEADISKISLDQKAQISLDAYPNQTFNGVVGQIIPQTKTTSSGTTVVSVRIKLDNPKLTFVHGLTGQASIILSEAKNTLVLPQETVREDDTVLVQTNNDLQPKKVVTGIKSDTDIEIKSGVSENDRVLLNPPALESRLNQNRNPLQGIIFRVFGGAGRGGGGQLKR